MKQKRPKRPRRALSEARIPLPKKTEKRHGDRTKYRRARERQRFREEIGKALDSDERR